VESAAASAFRALGGIVRAGSVIVDDSIAIELGPATLAGNQIDVNATVRALAAVEIDQATVRDRIAGMTAQRAKTELGDLGQVEVDLWPAWVDRIPRLTFRIDIQPRIQAPQQSAAPAPSQTPAP
jgi:hypothetical protein